MMQHHHHHPCNRFGFGLNPHQVNYPMQHHHHATNYHHQNHPSNYTSGSSMVHHHQHKPTNPWPTVPVSMPVNVSLPQQFNNLPRSEGTTPAVRDLPLTPPADREGSSVPVVSSSSPGSYYTMLHGPSMSAANNNLMGNYSQSPVDKSMTPPQDTSLHQHQHHQQHQQQPESINPALGWWSPASSAPAVPVPPAQCSTTDYTFHHHQMLAHHSTIQAQTATPVDTSRTPCASTSAPHQNPSEFQQRVAAALLKTHATLASRRCRRCRCPNCQVNCSTFLYFGIQFQYLTDSC